MIVDRRFLIEEDFELVKKEISELIERVASRTPEGGYDLEDLIIFQPVMTPEDSPLTTALQTAIKKVTGENAELVASPGTYDHKHVSRVAGVDHCVAYGPGILKMTHQPDEYCEVEAVVDATKVLSLVLLESVVGKH